MRIQAYRLILVLLLGFAPMAFGDNAENLNNADYAQVRQVRMQRRGEMWNISVTVFHNDEGWSHYADRWQVLDDDTGIILAERILAHPHDTEQPFTRSLNSVTIPDNVHYLRVRASCPNHGFGGGEIVFENPVDSGNSVVTITAEDSGGRAN